MIKILTIVGARPQFIKSSAISRSIATKFSQQIKEVIVHTGQHYDASMSEVFFDELGLTKEKYNLNVGSSNHANQTAQMMIEIDRVIDLEKPNAILVYGDTNSTLAASLVAVKKQIPVIHIEAGVRSFNKKFPEEINRLICDHTSSLLFTPTSSGVECLINEGFSYEDNYSIGFTNNLKLLNSPLVFKCGDIMYDNTLHFKNKGDEYFLSLCKKHELPKCNYILVTSHRPSNVDEPESLKNILSFFHYIINEMKKEIIFPIHPRTQRVIDNNYELQNLISKEGIHCIPPASFIEMIGLEKNADLIVTDSGGVQKEAYFMEKPCLIMLEETPWVELIESGNAKLVGNNYKLLCEGAKFFLSDNALSFEEIYGDGTSTDFICEMICRSLGS